MKRKLTTAFLAMSLLGFIALGIANITTTNHKLKTQDIQLQSKQSDLQLLEIKYKKLNIDLQTQLDAKTLDQKKVDDLQKQKDTLQKQLKDAQQQLQAKAEQHASTVAKLQQTASISAKAYAGVDYKMYIYMHESGNSTTSINSIGCRGLGQACPGTKLPCGDDYACQDAYFTNYAVQRYGGWEQAYNFWIIHSWW